MAKKIVKKKKKTRKINTRLILFFIIFGIIIGYLGYNLCYNLYKIIEIKKEQTLLDKKLDVLKEKEETLNSDINKLKDPEYIARYAREKYMYSKDGEIIIRLPDSK